jgi:F-type H+-transporting ATPase subunit a
MEDEMTFLAQGPGFHVPEVTHLFTFAPLFQFTVGGIVFKVTLVTLVMFAISLGMALLFWRAFHRPAVVPGKLQNAAEAGVDAIRTNIVLPTIGPEGERFVPLLTTMFFFVFALNFMGVFPLFQFPISSRMAIPVFLALISFLLFNALGIRRQGLLGYFKEMLFPPGMPKPLYVLLTPIEFLSKLVFRPLTLAIRLFANMMAGHVMLTIFFLASAYFLYRSDSWFLHIIAIAPFALSVILVGFEMFIALIQAFIFTILTAVYIDEALHPAH